MDTLFGNFRGYFHSLNPCLAVLFGILALIIVEKICGNIKHIDSTALKIDEVKIEWFDSYKKIARLTSQGNKLIGLKLTKTSGLNDGDILALENSEAIVISIIPTSTICVGLHDLGSVAHFCYEIGNLHAPLFFTQNTQEFHTPFEPVVQRMLERLKIDFQKKPCILESKNRLQSLFMKEPQMLYSPNFEIAFKKA